MTTSTSSAMSTADDLFAQFSRGRTFFEQGSPTEAASILAPVVAAAPDNDAALELYARALSASAQLARAEQALRTLVERRPDDGWARYALARTLERRGKDAGEHRRLAAALGVEG